MHPKIILKNKIVTPHKLVSFGFEQAHDHTYRYTCPLLNGQFTLTVFVVSENQLETCLIDNESKDEYILHLTDAVGEFVGAIRTEYQAIIQKISDTCFEPKIFKSNEAHNIISYIRDKYQNEFEYLWPRFSNNAIVRRADNKKWYALLLTVSGLKVGLSEDIPIEIIDLRYPADKMESLIDNKHYFPGYHMNKKHWISIRLDGSVSLPEIYEKIDTSFLLAQK